MKSQWPQQLLIYQVKYYLNKAANIVLTVPRFDKSISMSMPSASRAWKIYYKIPELLKCGKMSKGIFMGKGNEEMQRKNFKNRAPCSYASLDTCVSINI